jgi:glucosamine 6-phosphate synthetase-like amidotransferase/phosphosugar isomerase protein
MLYEVLQALKIRGYKSLGLTWISDQNKASLRQVEKLGCKQLHNLSLFKKNL